MITSQNFAHCKQSLPARILLTPSNDNQAELCALPAMTTGQAELGALQARATGQNCAHCKQGLPARTLHTASKDYRPELCTMQAKRLPARQNCAHCKQ